MWQAQGFGVLQKQTCSLLAVFCGKGFDRKTYETKNDGPIYPFPELVSAGRLEVRCLNNPSIDEYKQALESLEPDFVYLQGARCANEKEEIGSLVWGDVDLSTAEAITGLFGSKLPNTVYLEVPNGEKLAEALRLKGIPYVIYWKNAFSSYAACHFCQALISVLQSSSSHMWDAFQLAYASFRLYCVRNNHVLPVNGQKVSAKHGPHLLGDPPKVVMKEVAEDLGGEEGSSSEFPAIKIYDDEVTTRFLVCGLPCVLDACLLGYLEDGLNALLNIEIRGSKLHSRVSATPPPLAAGTFSRGVVTMRCDLSTCSSAHLSLLLSGSAQTCFDDQLLESHIKNELVERSQLVHSAPGCEEPKPSSCEPRRSISVACGASVFEVCMKVPAWASQVLRQLAPDVSYRSLVTLGIASVQGLAVASFEIDDAARLLFFCSKQSMTNLVNSPETPPEWFRPPVPCRSRLSSSHVTRSPANGTPNSCAVASTSKPEHGIDAKMETELTDSKPVVPCNQGFKVPAMRPIPHTRKHKLMPFSGVCDVEPYEGSHGKISTTSLPPLKPNYVPPAPPTYRKSSTNSFPSQPVIPLNPLPLKKHGCSRSPIQECPEEEFLRDVMQFLLLRGHNRLVPPGGLSEFPEAILNAKRLDLYNLYREVVSRGGFNVGNGINWKGQVFSKMRNHTTTNRMTGVGNTLKRHYETYLLEYELAHDDVAGECCLLCQSSEAGDWVNCSICDEWAHFGCDRRQGLGTFKDYSKTHGRDYICPRCSLSSYRGQPGRKSQKTANGYSKALAV